MCEFGEIKMAELSDILLREFGNRVRKERESQKLTLEDMYFHTGIDPSDFNKIEQGKTNITFRTLTKVANGLKVQPKKLFDFSIEFEK